MLIQPVEIRPADELGAVHFIAIGGAGMSAIAAAYHERGIPVSGSDRNDSDAVHALRDSGITCHIGHDPANLGNASLVVRSSAIPDDNVEVMEARRRGIPVWHRSAALGALMLGHRGVAITGTHGKTTTSGMAATMLLGVGADPSYVIGSPLTATGVAAHLGEGDAFVIEADESDGSYLQYPAEIVVITNIEQDHLDNWGTPDHYADGFYRLATKDGVKLVVACADDPGTQALIARLRDEGRSVVSYGEADDADIRLTNLVETAHDSSAIVQTTDDEGPVSLVVPGRFNLLNAAACYAVGRALGCDGPALRAAAATFHGTYRRFQPVGTAGDIRIFDDYAHHHTELDGTLAAARIRAGGNRVVACFQPHLFSRTRDYATQMGEALTHADVVVCCGVYPAREKAEDFPGVTGALVAEAVRSHGRETHYVEDYADAPALLATLVRPGDLVLTLGAGDVTKVGPALLDLLQNKDA